MGGDVKRKASSPSGDKRRSSAPAPISIGSFAVRSDGTRSLKRREADTINSDRKGSNPECGEKTEELETASTVAPSEDA